MTANLSGPPRRRPVLADVARAAGVSSQTVSRVVNGTPGVSDATRRRVQAVIEDLGYQPNAAAQALAAGRDRSVHVLTSETTLYGPATMLRGIESAAAEHGYRLSVSILEPGRTQEVVVRSAASGAACIVFAFDRIGLGALDLLPPGNRAVAVGDPDGRPVPSVSMAEHEGAADATRHLLALGHDTVHHLAVPVGAGRLRGWREALRDAGRRAPRAVQAGWDARSGVDATQRLLRLDPTVTAILCGNDDLALGALYALRRSGRCVPDDVSVVGFDDVPNAAYLEPPLTTVAQDFHAMGRAAFTLLLALTGAGPSSSDVQLHPHLVVRESTGPAPHSLADGSRG